MEGWGIAAAVGGGLVNALGYTVQKRALKATPTTYVRNPRWWGGFALLLVAESLGGVAFALVPAAVAVSLSSVTVVANGLFASRTETIATSVILGSALVVVGSVMVGVLTPSAEPLSLAVLETRLASSQSIVFQSVAAVACVGLEVYTRRVPRALAALATYAAVTSSFTALWFRPIVTFVLTNEWVAASYVPYVATAMVVLTGVWSAAVLEPRGLASFPQSQWIPVHFVACLVVFGTAGEVVYRDWVGTDAPAIVVLSVALLVLVFGVVLVSSAPKCDRIQR